MLLVTTRAIRHAWSSDRLAPYLRALERVGLPAWFIVIDALWIFNEELPGPFACFDDSVVAVPDEAAQFVAAQYRATIWMRESDNQGETL